MNTKDHLPREIELITDFLIECNMARIKAALYGEGHSIVAEAIRKSMDSIRKLFELRPTISIGSSGKTLLIDDHVLNRANPIFAEIAQVLFEKDIAAVSFTSELTATDMQAFLLYLAKGDSPNRGADTAERPFSVEHISLTRIDYGSIGFKEGAAGPQDKPQLLWENYINALLNGTLSADQTDTFVMKGRPADIAEILNRTLKTAGNISSYDRVIAAYLRGKAGTQAARVMSFMELIKALTPELKRQIAELAISRYSLDDNACLQLLRQLPIEDAAKIVQSLHGSIPESIRNLFVTLQPSGTERRLFDSVSNGTTIIKEFDIEIDQNILSLFQDDHFSNFVSDTYRSELKRLMKGPARITATMLSEIEKDCTDTEIERKFASLVVDLLDSSITSETDIGDLLSSVAAMAESFLSTGRFDNLVDIYLSLSRHAENRRFGDKVAVVRDQFFHSPEFFEKSITAITLWGRQNRDGVHRLIKTFAPYLREPILDALADEDDTALRKFMILLLMDLGPHVLEEAAARLNDNRWFVVRNMIYLIREMNGIQFSPNISTHARSDNKRIAVEAVRTLLQFKAIDAITSLVRLIDSPDPDISEEAIHLAGTYRAEEVVQKLLAILQGKVPHMSGESHKLAVIKTLNEIGDPRAIPYLRELAAPNFFSFRSPSEKMKSAIFRGLDNYPPDAVRPLVEIGIKSNKAEIQTSCRTWFKQHPHA